MDAEKLKSLRAQLDEVHDWPSIYMFKFIIPNEPENIDSLRGIFDESVDMREKLSKNGNYISFTIREMMLNADSIFDRYTRASSIKGIISL
ncbi:MAG: hypothetical protein ACI84C_002255 [Flavobacteriales bacterium]|jgi:hypothetical protein